MPPSQDVMFDWLDYHARYNGDALAAVDLDTDRRFTYAAFNDRATRLASGLKHRLGVEEGQRVSILAQNSTDFFELMFACRKVGAVFMPMNWRLTAYELGQITAHGEPTVVFVDEAHAGQLAESHVPHVVVRRPGRADCEYETLIAQAQPDVVMPRLTYDDMATLLYTSGTTGSPKGVIGTYRMVMNIVVQAAVHAEIDRRSRTLTHAPLFHTAGLNGAAMPLFHYGGALLVMQRWDTETVLKRIMDPELRITHCLGVPTNYIMMSERPEFETATFPTLKVLGVGSAPVSVELLQTWANKGLSLAQSFGMSEVFGVSFTPPHRAGELLGTAGFPLMHVDVQVGDDQGRERPRGQVGEIQMKGPGVTPGYWREPEMTQAAFVDGWFRSGDAAVMNEAGALTVVDRIKDMIISGGENIYPSEIEHVVSELPQVSQVAVIGQPDPKWGEIGVALVIPRDGRPITPAEVEAHCRTKLAGYKVPKRIEIVASLPLSPQGKVLKRELRRQYGETVQGPA